VVEHSDMSWEAWRAEHGAPLEVLGALAVWGDGSVTIDVGDGALRRLGSVVVDDFERRPDATGDRLVGRVSLHVDSLATPNPTRGRDELAGEVTTEWGRVRALERRLDELQGILEPMLASPFVDGPDGRYCFFCGKGEHADDCEVLRRDELLHRG
jgi:hypothetical protein